MSYGEQSLLMTACTMGIFLGLGKGFKSVCGPFIGELYD